jgi:hypothetical protein
MITGEGFAFFQYVIYRVKNGLWSDRPIPGWHCDGCRVSWRRWNPEKKRC